MTQPAPTPAPTPQWLPVASAGELAAGIPAAPLVLVLWGGAQCGICQAVKPKLLQLAQQHWPHVPLYYADCSVAPDACAQYRVFSLPVLRLFVHGKLAHEYVRAFSVHTVAADVARLQSLME